MMKAGVVILALIGLVVLTRKKKQSLLKAYFDDVDWAKQDLQPESQQNVQPSPDAGTSCITQNKRGRGVPVIIPSDMKDVLSYIADEKTREGAHIFQQNKYLFPNSSLGFHRSYDSLKAVAKECNLSEADRLTSVSLRKYTATLAQVMDLKETEIQWLCDHLGHSKRVHLAHYRQMSGFIERVEIGKMLLIQNNNLQGKFAGKKLSDIDVRAFGDKESFKAGCKRMDVDATFTLSVVQNGTVTGNKTIMTDAKSTADATCGLNILTVTFNETGAKWMLQFTQSGDEFSWTPMLTYVPTTVFPELSLKDGSVISSGPKVNLTTVGKSYKCNSMQQVEFAPYTSPLDNSTKYTATLMMSELQVQPFNLSTDDSFSEADECQADATSSTESTSTATSPSTESSSTESSSTESSTESTETSSKSTAATTESTATTPTPKPEVMYVLKDDNGTCLIMQGLIKVTVPYETDDNKTMSAKFDVPSDATVSGQCARDNETKANLTLTFGDNTLDFIFMDDKNSAEIQEVMLTVKLVEPFFPNASMPGEMMTLTSMAAFPLSDDTTFYMCRAGDTLKLSNDSMLNIMDLKVQAFGVMNDTFTGTGKDCDADKTTTASTSTAIPTTTPKPDTPPVNNFTVTDGNNTCIVMQGAFVLGVTYYLKNGTKATVDVNVPSLDKGDISGKCGDAMEEVTFTFFNGWSIMMVFKTVSGLEASDVGATDKYDLDNVTITYVFDSHLPGANETGTKIEMADSLDLFSANTDSSYKCNAKSNIAVKNVNLEVSNFRYQAFQTGNSTTFHTNVQECEADIETNSVVPIAVGAALAGLVVIVLIAYLIGRRKSRRAGYESV